MADLQFSAAVARVKVDKSSLHETTEALFSQLTDDEKLYLLDGDRKYSDRPWPHGEIKRLGIPGIHFIDGPRGINASRGTAFPVPMARGATWDVELEERVGGALGLEARAYGANTVGAVNINLPRHPTMGRAQEVYGEDPILLGEFGRACLRGLQKNVMGCVKHFALNSLETARFRVDVSIDDASLHEAFLPHFRRCIEAGAQSVMTAYNSVNGEWAGQNAQLLTDILRKQWEFEGFTISDWLFGLRDGVKSIKAGLDIEAPFRNHRARSTQSALASGELEWEDINPIARRLINAQLRHYSTRLIEDPSRDVVFCQHHRELAREVASKSIVLLKNEGPAGATVPVLPLSPEKVSSIAVIGRHADSNLTGDTGSSAVNCPEIVSPFRGLKDRCPSLDIRLVDSVSPNEAVDAAKAADAVVMIVGFDSNDEGEYLTPSIVDDRAAYMAMFPPFDESHVAQTMKNIFESPDPVHARGELKSALGNAPSPGDRQGLRLHPEEVRLIESVVSVNPNTVVSVVTAGAFITDDWRDKVPALLVSWYNGCENGHALADVLLGNINPSGRLPWSMPKAEEHLPLITIQDDHITYDKWFGQRLLDRLGVEAAFPLGFGLAYTQFVVESAEIRGANGKTIKVTVRNVGQRAGRTVVQVYGCPEFSTRDVDFPKRLLVGFQSVDLGPGELKAVEIDFSLRPIQRWINGQFVLDAEKLTLEVGQQANDPAAIKVDYSLQSA